MKIMYRDELGCIVVNVDDSGVSFANGYAYFTTVNGDDRIVPLDDVAAVWRCD